VHGLFVTGTDTGVGKTVVAAAITAALAGAGASVAAFKPVVTGLDEPDPGQPADHELLAACARMAPDEVAAWRFGPAVSPHLAARLDGREIDPATLVAAARRLARDRAVIVEGVGGLLVPLTARGALVADLAASLALPVVVVARPGLGTINHTLLTLAAARAAGLDVRAVVLSPWPSRPAVLERSNRETIAELGRVEVATLPAITPLEPGPLARAGAALPYERWLGGQSS
jgi:dethiobiotin synthetase